MSTWDYIMKFVVVGDSNTGKSSLLVQLTDKRFLTQSDPTIGVEFGASLISLPNGKTIKVQVWDTAGQESFRSITRSYYRGASGALLVFDTTYRPSFQHLENWLKDLKSFGDPNLVIVLVGNKSDLITSNSQSDSSSTSTRQVSVEEAQQWAIDHDLQYIETSAKTGENVEEAFASVAKQIHQLGFLDQSKSNRNNTINKGSSFPIHSTSSTSSFNSCCSK
ncbi:uncharacterized protein MELLADRAFT_84389 [Melampsora larici-populina 98AG31]|uniref:Uncharacterized protein n=1 Tax=Melampsora larici-populina (strain 98AG31 / pathotype 3-4-7) TaxID=747676 RepID=F4RFK9_MELLP|nr:uncharacterized protein MELLADRAFT_84389 [Melampsora larici-populina 98AG31]EGG08909.1 hypothetical protein MELLADRAFT_84389 [Melampsora larici-populina 98AG31]